MHTYNIVSKLYSSKISVNKALFFGPIIILFNMLACHPSHHLTRQQHKELQKNIHEGKEMYYLERASWISTDLFLQNDKDLRYSVGGYFSYEDKKGVITIFFSKDSIPQTVKSYRFHDKPDTNSVIISSEKRGLNEKEKLLYRIREAAVSLVRNDSFFRTYSKSSLNFIPMVGEENKVYILTGANEPGWVFFGNDYCINFDKQGNATTVRRLHHDLISYKEEDGAEHTFHTHLPSTGEFFTATDICTLLLYGPIMHWKRHDVVGPHYRSAWDCRMHKLKIENRIEPLVHQKN